MREVNWVYNGFSEDREDDKISVTIRLRIKDDNPCVGFTSLFWLEHPRNVL